MDVRRRCTYYEKPNHQFTTSSQIKCRTEAYVCVYIRHKSLLWSTFVESKEITKLTQGFYSRIQFYLAVFCRRQEVGLGMGLEGESLVFCLPLPGLESVLRVSGELRHGLAGPRDNTGLWTRWCGSFVQKPLTAHSTAPVLSKYSALSLCNLSSKSSKCLY